MKVLILGWSEIGEELFKLCVQNCHFINRKKTSITLVYPHTEQIESKLGSRFRQVDQVVDFQPIQQNPLYLTSRFLLDHGLVQPDIVYICSREDRYQVSYCTKARELFGEKVAIVRPFYKNVILWKETNITNIFSFNILEKVCNIDNMAGESLDKRAVMVHHHWLKQAVSDYIDTAEKALANGRNIPEPKPTLVPWYLLDEEIHDDNRSVVDHLNVKLRSTGQLSDPAYYDCPEKSNINYGFLNDNTWVENLAEMEHRRWSANKYLYGWNPGKERNVLLREHESLKDYSELDDSTRNYDREQIKRMKDLLG